MNAKGILWAEARNLAQIKNRNEDLLFGSEVIVLDGLAPSAVRHYMCHRIGEQSSSANTVALKDLPERIWKKKSFLGRRVRTCHAVPKKRQRK